MFIKLTIMYVWEDEVVKEEIFYNINEIKKFFEPDKDDSVKGSMGAIVLQDDGVRYCKETPEEILKMINEARKGV